MKLSLFILFTGESVAHLSRLLVKVWHISLVYWWKCGTFLSFTGESVAHCQWTECGFVLLLLFLGYVSELIKEWLVLRLFSDLAEFHFTSKQNESFRSRLWCPITALSIRAPQQKHVLAESRVWEGQWAQYFKWQNAPDTGVSVCVCVCVFVCACV